ncbi:hypothetical protein B0H34DRAFT_859849 [Crassisporium funariophilum]|nr:hypothetical protein B0H34DRAFT_859849 [Crassisporium funariophilum]
MAPKSDNAQWTSEDETTLLGYLKQHIAEGGDNATFKKTTFHKAALEVEKIRTKGGKKVGASCQNKWNAVCQAIQSMSGWTWSNTRGADISPEMEPEWEKFVMLHKDAKPFKNQGWIHLKVMTKIMPTTLCGTHVFRPTQGISGLDASATVGPAASDSDSEDAQADKDDGESVEQETDVEVSVVAPHRNAEVKFSVNTPARRRATASSHAIDGLTQSISVFGRDLCTVLAMDPKLRTPHRRKEAITRAQTEDWLPIQAQLTFVRVLEKDIQAVDAYLALNPEREDFYRLWIEDTVANN